MDLDISCYKNKYIITGHTGFKGSWLSLVKRIRAKIIGISKEIVHKKDYMLICQRKLLL